MRSYTAAPHLPKNDSRFQSDCVSVSPELVEEYLAFLEENSCAPETIKGYRQKLNRLYQFLPGDKTIRAGTLEAWRDSLAEGGYSASTVNGYAAAANGLMLYCGHRDLLIEKTMRHDGENQPELTRNEYLRLLSTARALGKEQDYLLVKVFGSTGLGLRELSLLTAEAVEAGEVWLPESRLHIPDCLREELLDYIQRLGIVSGPVFVTRTGMPFSRNCVSKTLRALCRAACVPEEKATARGLKRLYQATRDEIQNSISLLVEQAHDRLLETEQLTIGWSEKRAVGK